MNYTHVYACKECASAFAGSSTRPDTDGDECPDCGFEGPEVDYANGQTSRDDWYSEVSL